MSELETSFARLLDRQPTDAERNTLYRMRDALDLKHDDALWLVLMALQYYQTQYEEMPDRIVRVADTVMTRVEAAAEKQAQASMQAVKADLASAVAATARDVAHRVAGRAKLQWMVCCVVVVTLCLAGTGWSAFQAGEKHGLALGYPKMEAEKAIMQWAVTEEGQQAYELAQAGPGNIPTLLRCAGEGWHREEYQDGYACFPRGSQDGKLSGWRVP